MREREKWVCSQVKRGGGVNEFQREREGGFEKGETGKGGGGGNRRRRRQCNFLKWDK